MPADPLRLVITCTRCGTRSSQDFKDLTSLERYARSQKIVLCDDCQRRETRSGNGS